MTLKEIHLDEKEMKELVKMVSEIHHEIFGVKGSPDLGLSGEMQYHRKGLRDLASRVTKLEVVFYGGTVIAFVITVTKMFA